MKFKKITTALAIGLMISILVSIAQFEVSCEEIKNNVLRLHILANSDTQEDQALKLKVRDKLLEAGDIELKNEDNLNLAIEKVEEILPNLQSIAQKTIKENGYNYDCKVYLGKAWFNTRVYEDFTLPAGEYDALKVEIGKAEGKNWWCVIFPSLCVSSASKASIGDVVNEKAANITKNPTKYKVRFKIVEWYETIKNKYI